MECILNDLLLNDVYFQLKIHLFDVLTFVKLLAVRHTRCKQVVNISCIYTGCRKCLMIW